MEDKPILGTGGGLASKTGPHFGQMPADKEQDFLDRVERDPESLADTLHPEPINRFDVAGIAPTVWQLMRGALSPTACKIYSFNHTLMTTGMGMITLKESP
jgi:hypothetical protein